MLCYLIDILKCCVLDSLKSDEERDIHEILAFVNYTVASLKPRNVYDGKNYHKDVIQLPEILSTLTSPVRLCPTENPEKTTV